MHLTSHATVKEHVKNCAKSYGKLTSLAIAQEQVTFDRPSKKLAENFVKKNALELALECRASCLPLFLKPRILAQFQEHFFSKGFANFFEGKPMVTCS